MSDNAGMIAEARNPMTHGDDSDHCAACFGSCGAWPGERVGDGEELILRLADAIEAAGRGGMSALEDVAAERVRQNAKWGVQNHPDGTGPDVCMLEWIPRLYGTEINGEQMARAAKRDTDIAAGSGAVTWRQILMEEVAEAFAERDIDKLRVELIQVAAVATAWAEAIDRREAAPTPRPHTPDVALPGGGKRITVKRACNGCDRLIGDATAVELDAAVEGRPLPDVRDECGCNR